MAVIASFYRWAHFHGSVFRIDPIPDRGLRGRGNPLKVATDTIPPRAIPLGDLSMICAELPLKYRLATQLSLLSGMRQFEVAELALDKLRKRPEKQSPLHTLP